MKRENIEKPSVTLIVPVYNEMCIRDRPMYPAQLQDSFPLF